MNFSTTFKFIEMHLYMQAPKNCLQALDSVYHGALRLITKSLTHKITKTLLIIVYYAFMLDGRRCHPVDLSIGTYLYIKSF